MRALLGARGHGLRVAQLPLQLPRIGHDRNLRVRRLGQAEHPTDRMRQLVEDAGVSRHHLVGHGPHREEHVAAVAQRDADDRDFDADAARVVDERLETAGVRVDLDDQDADILVVLNPAAGRSQVGCPRDGNIGPDAAKGEARCFRGLAFSSDVEKLHARQPRQGSGASGGLSV